MAGVDTDFVMEPVKVFENTYETKPKDGEKFEHTAVQRVIRETLQQYLQGKVYDQNECVQLSKQLCDVIQENVKRLNMPRYKLVVQCTIGENKGQGTRVASRCLWDTENDNFASDSFTNTSLFCVAMVFGLYYE